MLDIRTATLEQFTPCLQQSFVLHHAQAGDVELRLVEAKALRAHAPASGRRQGYSLLFRGPLEPLLPQAIHALSNRTLGELRLFLVPVGPEGGGMGYEAVIT